MARITKGCLKTMTPFWPHLSTAVAWREKSTKCFVKYIYFCLWLGVLKSRISEKFGEPLQSYLLTDQADSAKKAGLGRAS